MASVAPKARKHLSADALFRLVHTGFDHIPDYRPAGVDISLPDVLMSASAISGDLLSAVISIRYIFGFRKDNPNVFNSLIQSWPHF